MTKNYPLANRYYPFICHYQPLLQLVPQGSYKKYVPLPCQIIDYWRVIDCETRENHGVIQPHDAMMVASDSTDLKREGLGLQRLKRTGAWSTSMNMYEALVMRLIMVSYVVNNG